jgi:hypothetical protein
MVHRPPRTQVAFLSAGLLLSGSNQDRLTAGLHPDATVAQRASLGGKIDGRIESRTSCACFVTSERDAFAASERTFAAGTGRSHACVQVRPAHRRLSSQGQRSRRRDAILALNARRTHQQALVLFGRSQADAHRTLGGGASDDTGRSMPEKHAADEAGRKQYVRKSGRIAWQANLKEKRPLEGSGTANPAGSGKKPQKDYSKGVALTHSMCEARKLAGSSTRDLPAFLCGRQNCLEARPPVKGGPHFARSPKAKCRLKRKRTNSSSGFLAKRACAEESAT